MATKKVCEFKMEVPGSKSHYTIIDLKFAQLHQVYSGVLFLPEISSGDIRN